MKDTGNNEIITSKDAFVNMINFQQMQAVSSSLSRTDATTTGQQQA